MRLFVKLFVPESASASVYTSQAALVPVVLALIYVGFYGCCLVSRNLTLPIQVSLEDFSPIFSPF